MADRHAAEREARAHVQGVDGEREGWVCTLCDEDPSPVATFVITEEDGSGYPVCQWHADEYVHDAIPYGQNCTECGVQHNALWPSGELQ